MQNLITSEKNESIVYGHFICQFTRNTVFFPFDQPVPMFSDGGGRKPLQTQRELLGDFGGSTFFLILGH